MQFKTQAIQISIHLKKNSQLTKDHTFKKLTSKTITKKKHKQQKLTIKTTTHRTKNSQFQ